MKEKPYTLEWWLDIFAMSVLNSNAICPIKRNRYSVLSRYIRARIIYKFGENFDVKLTTNEGIRMVIKASRIKKDEIN